MARVEGLRGDEPDAGGAADLRRVQDASLDGEHLAGGVPGGLGRVPDAATVTTDQARRCFDAFGRLQTDHHRIGENGVGELLDVRAHEACLVAEGGIHMAGDGLHDVAAGERRPLAAQLAYDVGDHVCRGEGRTKALRTDGRLDDCGGFPAGVAGFGRPPLVQAQLGDVLARFGATRVEHRQAIDPPAFIGLQRPRPSARSSSAIFASAAASTSSLRVLKRASSCWGMPASSA